MRELLFFVAGKPQPGGSKRMVKNKATQQSMIIDANPKAKDWKSSVAQVAASTFQGIEPFAGPVKVSFRFQLSRPKGHFGSGKNADQVKLSAPKFPTGKPDVLKLARSTEDSLTGILWRDDAQIVHEVLKKVYVLPDPFGTTSVIGCWIKVEEAE